MSAIILVFVFYWHKTSLSLSAIENIDNVNYNINLISIRWVDHKQEQYQAKKGQGALGKKEFEK